MKTVDIAEAVGALKAGKVIAYPTEAVWGLGCDPFNQSAVEQLLQIKQRAVEKGLILIAGSIDQVLPYLQSLPLDRQQQIIESWSDCSKAVTWLLPLHINIPHWVSGEHARVGFRVSHHPVCQQLCQQFGLLVSTSANPTTQPAATDAEQIVQYFSTQDMVMTNGDVGGHQSPSKIVDALTAKIIRY